jgi:hypothetical protein
MTWLPSPWPANARLLATAIPGPHTEALASRPGFTLHRLEPLSPEESAAIARAVCARYHRDLPPDVLAALLTKRLPDGSPAAGSPLWLVVALEELNLLDGDFRRADREFTGDPEERL